LDEVSTWPQEDQEELAEVAREIEARRIGVYRPTTEELVAIDEATEQIERGDVASEAEIEAAYQKFRGA
jgi:hypothetical protein